jgi:hypothetical protein
VQVHFKYSHVQPANTGIDVDATAIRYIHAADSTEKSIVKFNKANTLSIKVSKRYVHQNIFEIFVTTLPVTRAFPSIRQLCTYPDSRLYQLFLSRPLLRGPPAIA